MRMNFELPEERVNELKELQTETGSESMKELFNNALTMLEWAIKEVKHGNEIAAVNEEEKVYRVFITPLLERVAKKYRPEPAVAARGAKPSAVFEEYKEQRKNDRAAIHGARS